MWLFLSLLHGGEGGGRGQDFTTTHNEVRKSKKTETFSFVLMVNKYQYVSVFFSVNLIKRTRNRTNVHRKSDV